MIKSKVILAILMALSFTLSGCEGGDNETQGTGPTEAEQETYTRVLSDQPDNTNDNHLVHIVYAVPSGNEDKERDINYELQTSVLAANNWLNDISSGKKLKLDLQDNGDVDITFWPMLQTNAELHKSDWQMRDTIEAELKKTNWYNPDKLYVVYFEGSHQRTCGDAPTWGEHVLGIYLHDAKLDPAYDCARNKLASNQDSHGFMEYVLIHELVHVLGVHHTSDSNTDLMYAGSQPWQPSILDFNQDDYYMHSASDKIDILYSAFLFPSDGAELPVNWRKYD